MQYNREELDKYLFIFTSCLLAVDQWHPPPVKQFQTCPYDRTWKHKVTTRITFSQHWIGGVNAVNHEDQYRYKQTNKGTNQLTNKLKTKSNKQINKQKTQTHKSTNAHTYKHTNAHHTKTHITQKHISHKSTSLKDPRIVPYPLATLKCAHA